MKSAKQMLYEEGSLWRKMPSAAFDTFAFPWMCERKRGNEGLVQTARIVLDGIYFREASKNAFDEQT